MGLAKTTLRLENLCELQNSEMNLETETELPKTDQLSDEQSMEHKSNEEEQSSPEKDLLYMVSEASPNISKYSCSMDILYNDELDFLEVQKVNNIMRAAYKEFMTIAVKAKAWVSNCPVVGSVEDLQERFHTPPPHGSTVECSVESAMLPISSRSLIQIMMDAGRWASMFSNIIWFASEEEVLTPLKTFLSTDKTEVILVNAQFRLPAEFLPRWSTRFLRFKKTIMPDTCAIFDVSTDYFEDTTFDPTKRIEYKRKPSGVIIRECGLLSEVIWVENAEVEEIYTPKNICSTLPSNFPFTAKHFISMSLQNLKRRRSRVVTSELFDGTDEVPNLMIIGENLKRFYVETVNPFPRERTWDLFSDDKIRILRDMKAIGCQNDYIASSTIYVPEPPIRLVTFLDVYNVKIQWSSIKSLAQLNMALVFFTEDESNCITLRAKIETGAEEAFEGHDFFLQETSVNEYCSFVLSSRMTEADVHISLIPRFCVKSEFLKPSGFAIMPAGPGGLEAEASIVTICIRRELENMDVDQAIEAMSSHMNAVIDQITHIESPKVKKEDDSEQNTL